MIEFNEKGITVKLVKCWSKESSTLWTQENPAKGQCSVTAIVIQEFFGGSIMKTKLESGQFHFYNLINSKRIDFTKEQFPEPLNYDDVLSSREEAFGDTNLKQYNYLKYAFEQELLIL